VPVPSRGIRLPHFDESICYRSTVFIEDPAAHNDSFAERRSLVLNREIVVEALHAAVTKDRPAQFREGLRNHDQGLGW
jgi:hypothetical protein